MKKGGEGTAGKGTGGREYRPCRDVSTKGCKGKSTVAWIRAIVAFNDSFRDRSGISYNSTFRLPSRAIEGTTSPSMHRHERRATGYRPLSATRYDFSGDDARSALCGIYYDA